MVSSATSPTTCTCGAGPACGPGQVCVTRPGEAATCRCATRNGGTSGSGVVYSGCNFLGDVDRVVVGKYDPARSLCFDIVFSNGTNTSGVTLPASWRVERVFAAPSGGVCGVRTPPAAATTSTSQTGTASWTTGTGSPFETANVDVVLAFPAGVAGIPTSEPVQATNVDVSRPCSN